MSLETAADNLQKGEEEAQQHKGRVLTQEQNTQLAQHAGVETFEESDVSETERRIGDSMGALDDILGEFERTVAPEQTLADVAARQKGVEMDSSAQPWEALLHRPSGPEQHRTQYRQLPLTREIVQRNRHHYKQVAGPLLDSIQRNMLQNKLADRMVSRQQVQQLSTSDT